MFICSGGWSAKALLVSRYWSASFDGNEGVLMVLMHYEGQTLSVEPIKNVDLLTEISPFFWFFFFSSPLMISGRSVFFFFMFCCYYYWSYMLFCKIQANIKMVNAKQIQARK